MEVVLPFSKLVKVLKPFLSPIWDTKVEGLLISWRPWWGFT